MGAMKIYTKTGDEGQTGLFGGERVDKDDPRVEAYGTVDETNSAIGLSRAAGLPREIDQLLGRVQCDLFALGAELACVSGKEDRLGMTRLSQSDIEQLEHAIDDAEHELEPLKSFVLPGGTPSAAALHHARTVCRRAERRTLSMAHGIAVRRELLIYLNRLSDLLFVLARRANQTAGISDVPWQPRQ